MSEGPKTRVLVVDDDTTLLEMYKARLEASGYDVITASNGEDGLSKAIETVPQAIILDVMMPKVNGFDVLSMLKDHKETKDIPVIILTALTQENHKKKGLEEGADGFIVKSETMPKDVVAKIESVIADRKKKMEESAS